MGTSFREKEQERTGESGAFGLWPHPRGSSRMSLLKSGPGNRGRSACGPTHVAPLEFPRETGLTLRGAGTAFLSRCPHQAAAGPGEATSTSPSFGCAQEERLTQLSPPLLATQPQEVPRHRLARFQHGGPRSSRHTIQADSPRPSRQGGPYSTWPFPLTSAKLGLPFPPRPVPSSSRRKILLLRPTGP